MRTRYGVVWHEPGLPDATGRLELLPRELRLEGLADSKPTERSIPYKGLTGVRVGRAASERIGGRPSIVLERRAASPITIATVAQPSLVGEIVERLTALQLGAEATSRVAFVVPLNQESQDAVRALLEDGPPFDPEQVIGLDRHEVFLTAHEAVFVFEAPLGADALEPLLAEPALWRAAAEWRQHLAGPPRIAEGVYSWSRPEREHAANGSGDDEVFARPQHDNPDR